MNVTSTNLFVFGAFIHVLTAGAGLNFPTITEALGLGHHYDALCDNRLRCEVSWSGLSLNWYLKVLSDAIQAIIRRFMPFDNVIDTSRDSTAFAFIGYRPSVPYPLVGQMPQKTKNWSDEFFKFPQFLFKRLLDAVQSQLTCFWLGWPAASTAACARPCRQNRYKCNYYITCNNR